MMQILQNLINNTECLYCSNQCRRTRFHLKELPSLYRPKITEYFYKCNFCAEHFSIYFFEHFVNKEISFTCKNLYIRTYRNFNFKKYFDLLEDDCKLLFISNGKNLISIPRFDLNFSNKENLFNKLNTYILYS